MIKVAKAQGSVGDARSFSSLWHLGAPVLPSSSETQQWPGTTYYARAGPLGQQGPHSALSLQETQAHLLMGNEDNAGHTLHLPCLRGQGHLILLDQLGGKRIRDSYSL